MGYWSNKSVVCTGGAGLVGSHLVELLVDAGARVTVADNFERGCLENLSAVKDKVRIVNADMTKLDQAAKAIVGCEVVFNLAAKVTSIEYNASHHAEMFYHNMLLQMIPLRATSEVNVERFLQASTVCCYPHNASIPTPESAADVSCPEPTNAGYGYAKLIGERLTKWYIDQGLIKDACITRFANCFGPRDYFDRKTSHVIPALIRKCLEHNEIVVWGDGEQRREFLFAKDAALGAMLVCEKYPVPEPVNIGPGRNVSINELLAMIQDILGTKKPVRHVFDKPVGHRERLVDNSKLKQVTGWIPQTPLYDGLVETVKWYKSQS